MILPFEQQKAELKRRKEKALQMGGRRKSSASMIKDNSPYLAARMHYLHDVIDPRDTRDYLIRALKISQDRRTGGVSAHHLANWPTKF
jgi:acetyl-CoA carboxylase carboxyltransferase component